MFEAMLANAVAHDMKPQAFMPANLIGRGAAVSTASQQNFTFATKPAAGPAKEGSPFPSPLVDAPWQEITKRRMARTLSLADGWDGPGTAAVSSTLAIFADRLLKVALGDQQNAPAPYVVAMRDGGLQLEWHTKSTEIEIYIDAAGAVSTWTHDRDSGEEVEEEGLAAKNLFIRWAPRLLPKADSSRSHPLTQAI